MSTKCCWVIHGSLTSERKASTSPSSFINHSILLLNRALKRQAPCFYMHFEVRALDRLRTRRRVGSTRRRGNHMHDHSRFQRDINDVTGVSLSLSLSLSQKSLTHNIGSASALPIINCLKHVNEMLLGDPRQSDQRTQSFHFPIVVHQSLDPAAQSSAQAPSSLFLHALRSSSARQAQNASTRWVDAPSR